MHPDSVWITWENWGPHARSAQVAILNELAQEIADAKFYSSSAPQQITTITEEETETFGAGPLTESEREWLEECVEMEESNNLDIGKAQELGMAGVWG